MFEDQISPVCFYRRFHVLGNLLTHSYIVFSGQRADSRGNNVRTIAHVTSTPPLENSKRRNSMHRRDYLSQYGFSLKGNLLSSKGQRRGRDETSIRS